jgi:dTDP-4-amino-4,6-dideoxygalactose transaminase
MQSLGYNYRMTDIQAAIGSTQLKRLDAFITKRRRIADIYKRAFRSNRYFDTPMTETKDSVSACHIYPIRLKDAYKDKRGEIFAKLRSRGIGVQVHYIPVYLHPYYQKLGYKKGICPNAEDYYERTITLPLHTMMSVEDADGVVRTLFRILEDIDKGCSRPKG